MKTVLSEVANSKQTVHTARYRRLAALFLFFSILLSQSSVVSSAEKWTGVDESVIERYAKEHGREARAPLINTDQGDLLLFVFLLAGAVGGFFAGYYWKTLTLKSDAGSRSQNGYKTGETEAEK
jgi:cobalt/nickel transport protein